MRQSRQTTCNPVVQHTTQQGSVLLISLIFMVILTLAATTTMRTSTLEMQMAGNEETRIRTLELAQSIVDEVVGEPDNMVVSGEVGDVNCTNNVAGCDNYSVTVDETLIPAADQPNVSVVVERLTPALSPAPRGINSSADAFFAARFQVDSTYDGSDQGEGNAGVVQGVIILVPRGAQTN